jgi:hypothetical protein
MKEFGPEGNCSKKLFSSAATRRSALADASYSMHCFANVNIWRFTNINSDRKCVDNFSASSAVGTANAEAAVELDFERSGLVGWHARRKG